MAQKTILVTYTSAKKLQHVPGSEQPPLDGNQHLAEATAHYLQSRGYDARAHKITDAAATAEFEAQLKSTPVDMVVATHDPRLTPVEKESHLQQLGQMIKSVPTTSFIICDLGEPEKLPESIPQDAKARFITLIGPGTKALVPALEELIGPGEMRSGTDHHPRNGSNAKGRS